MIASPLDTAVEDFTSSASNPVGALSQATATPDPNAAALNALVGQLGSDNAATRAIAQGLLSQGITDAQNLGVRQVMQTQYQPYVEDVSPGGAVDVPVNQFYNTATGAEINPTRLGIIQSGTNGVSGGDIFYNLNADPTGNITFDPQWSPRSHGFLRDNPVGQAIMAIGSILPVTAPYVLAARAIDAAAHDNPMGAIQLALAGGAAGDVGGYGTQFKDAANAVGAVNALSNNNLGGAIALASNISGASGALATPISDTGVTVGDVVKTTSIAASLANNQIGDAVKMAGSLINSPDLKVAGNAINLINAAETGSIGQILSAGNALVNSIPSSVKLSDPGSSAFLAAKQAGASDTDAAAAAGTVTGTVPSTATTAPAATPAPAEPVTVSDTPIKIGDLYYYPMSNNGAAYTDEDGKVHYISAEEFEADLLGRVAPSVATIGTTSAAQEVALPSVETVGAREELTPTPAVASTSTVAPVSIKQIPLENVTVAGKKEEPTPVPPVASTPTTTPEVPLENVTIAGKKEEPIPAPPVATAPTATPEVPLAPVTVIAKKDEPAPVPPVEPTPPATVAAPAIPLAPVTVTAKKDEPAPIPPVEAAPVVTPQTLDSVTVTAKKDMPEPTPEVPFPTATITAKAETPTTPAKQEPITSTPITTTPSSTATSSGTISTAAVTPTLGKAKTSSPDEFWLGGKFKKGFNPLKGFEYLLGAGSPYADQLQSLVDALKDSGPKLTAEEAAKLASEAPPEPTYSYYTYGNEPVINVATTRLAKGGNVLGNAPSDTMMASPLMAAHGGVPHKGSHYVQGAGGGQDDLIPARLADGEYVFDAEIVAALGDGSNKEGAKKLDAMREAIRKHKRSGPLNTIPPKAKSPLAYLKGLK
jgi:hypothetical protein